MRNKVLCLLLALLMCGAALACNQSDGKKPDVTAEPTAEVQATEVPEPTEQPIDAAIISNYQGDWFGVFAITDCGGSFDGAKDMTNDCFVRFALQAAGTGESYILVNGNGDGLFAECMVKAAPDKLLLSGLIAGSQPLKHGVSVTDACISFAQTVPVLEQLAAAVRTRRAKNKA